MVKTQTKSNQKRVEAELNIFFSFNWRLMEARDHCLYSGSIRIGLKGQKVDHYYRRSVLTRRQVHANVLKRVQTHNRLHVTAGVYALYHTAKQPIGELVFSCQIHIQTTFWEPRRFLKRPMADKRQSNYTLETVTLHGSDALCQPQVLEKKK